MLQSVEEVYNEIWRDRAIEKDKKIIEKLCLKKLIEEKTMEITIEIIAVRALLKRWLIKEQIMEVTDLSSERIDELEEIINSVWSP